MKVYYNLRTITRIEQLAAFLIKECLLLRFLITASNEGEYDVHQGQPRRLY